MSFGLPLEDEGLSRCTWTLSVGDLQSPNSLSDLVVAIAKIPEGTDLWEISPRQLLTAACSMTGSGSVRAAIGVPEREWRARS